MPLSPSDKLGRYEILARLGAGGRGELCKANDTRLDRTVAVKTSKTEFSERFEREAIAALNYYQICQLMSGRIIRCPKQYVFKLSDSHVEPAR